MKIAFTAYDYCTDASFLESAYEFDGHCETGWIIRRNGELYLKLGPGYRLLKSKYCGICSTDLARQHLPFPLPQVIGHEVIATDPETGTDYAVEINDSCLAHRALTPEIFCKSDLPSHCPERMVLGIDRLPGGFGPYILAPRNALVPVGDIPSKCAVLIEPFAAACQALVASPPGKNEHIAVLGLGRLGLLLICALVLHRKSTNCDYIISGIDNKINRCDLSIKLGADKAFQTEELPVPGTGNIDRIYDATGSPEGFEQALTYARKEVHLKSTHGRPFRGLRHLTELVVDELSILPFSEPNLSFTWKNESRKNRLIYRAPDTEIITPDTFSTFTGSPLEAVQFLKSHHFHGKLPRFDIGIASSLSEIDSITRPTKENQESLVRPRGAILFNGPHRGHPLTEFINSGKIIRTSRCGDFRSALSLLNNNRDMASLMATTLISETCNAEELPGAFKKAENQQSLKVIIHHT